ncbi:MAG: class II SORL domain-containing protein [Promethearchaeota archaeon]|jgi:superoxide reductase
MVQSIGEKLQRDDWKKEKHVPVIELPEKINLDEWTQVKVTVGKEIEHPNSVEHHIRWIRVYFVPEKSKFAYDIGNWEFASHGEGPVNTQSLVKFGFKTKESGTLNAISYCNIHGLWESSQKISVE